MPLTSRATDFLRITTDQPGWVWRGALAIVAFILLLPIVVLIIIALLAGVIVFGALALMSMLLGRLRGVLPRNDGRENVRVVARRE